MTEPQLEPELERVALALLRHLEWQDSGFSLSFLFADFGTLQRLDHWVNERLRLQGRPIQRYEVEQSDADRPEDMVDRLVEMTTPREQPLWFGFQEFAADDSWNNARCRFLARLNERRFLLEKQFARPLVLVLPVGFREQARTLAPDIWHVRTMSEELKSPMRSARISTPPEPSPTASVATPLSKDIPVPAYDDWVRIRRHDGLDRMEPRAVSVVVRDLLAAGRPGDAHRVSQEALKIAQRKDGNDGRRGLTIANACVGDVALACGDWPEAQRAYGEALQVSREIHRASAASLESMRDLSISLDNIGRVAAAQSEWKSAEEVYRESLEIRRALQERLGGTPTTLRDLLVSLEGLERAMVGLGDVDGAGVLAAEAKAIKAALEDQVSAGAS